ncbi:uncharacterized protein CLUP02_14494 [Colletotrichum lupini]|uniref:Uncharacterized protein n=1 Tax=Colletotrichum lupini TaxID=145971 RepID=A0A9Q8T691_9PEZI|nr:uncharacterized protein CLUP02_14494 [Colletotrichum lupini]UQC88967.1 hypothetical protein CLUP02_14494 [Colletotrichum lupini]
MLQLVHHHFPLPTTPKEGKRNWSGLPSQGSPGATWPVGSFSSYGSACQAMIKLPRIIATLPMFADRSSSPLGSEARRFG